MRFSQWDIDAKRATGIMRQALESLSKQSDILYVYANRLTDEGMIAFVKSLPNLIKLVIDHAHFSDGWAYAGNSALDHLMNQMDHYPVPIDWVLFPDSDDLLPCNVRAEVEKAASEGKTCIEFPRIETRGEKIIDIAGSPCGPHVLGAKWKPSWRDSVGFNIPDGTPMDNIYHCRYPTRHLRYATPDLIEARKSVGYYEQYADKEWRTTDFHPDWTWQDYERHFAT